MSADPKDNIHKKVYSKQEPEEIEGLPIREVNIEPYKEDLSMHSHFEPAAIEKNSIEDYPNQEPLNANNYDDLEIEEKPKNPVARFFWRIHKFSLKYRKQIVILFLFLFIIGAVGVSASAIWLMNRYNTFDNIVEQATEFDEGSIVYDRNDKELFRYSADGEDREKIGINEIPQNIQGAIVALEDENYYQNPAGIPWQNLAGASIKCLVPGAGDCRGGSGLSQQLIKNVTGDDQRTTGRKINELLAAIRYNQDVKPGGTEREKQDAVLEGYLNWVPFGRNTYGIKTAAGSYFNKNVATEGLTIPESCYMASMVQRPSTFATAIDIEIRNRQAQEIDKVANPNWDLLQTRKNVCIQKMHELNLKNYGTEKFIQTEAEFLALFLARYASVAFIIAKAANNPKLNFGFARITSYSFASFNIFLCFLPYFQK
jgi:hypothetical protein